MKLLKPLGLLLSLTMAASAPALAQTFPNKPVNLMVPYPAGGGIDVMSRLLGQQLSQRLGQPVVIENKPGAGTIVAAESVARAAPDGRGNHAPQQQVAGVEQDADGYERHRAAECIGVGAALDVRLGTDQGQTIHHPEGSIAGAGGQLASARQGDPQQQQPTGDVAYWLKSMQAVERVSCP